MEITPKQLIPLLANTKSGQHAKLLKKIRQCNNCPLGAKKQQIKIGGNLIDRIVPAVCKFYEPDKKDCPIGYEEYIKKLRVYHNFKNLTDIDLMRILIQDVFQDTIIARDKEMIKEGAGGFWTLKFQELLGNLLRDRHKMIYGERFQGVIGVVGEDTASKLVKEVLSKRSIEEGQIIEARSEVKE